MFVLKNLRVSSKALHRAFRATPCRQQCIPKEILERATSMGKRHAEILSLLERPTTHQDAKSLLEELTLLTPTASSLEDRNDLVEEASVLESMLSDALASEPSMAEELREELSSVMARIEETSLELLEATLPAEDEGPSDAILEIRAGTGGVEASLFASELLECYLTHAREKKWRVELLSRSGSPGTREATYSLSGGDPYGCLKFESGVHRVQRVPSNDVRIHTSTASVAVLAAREEVEVSIPREDLKIETTRSSGAGGQHVNTTDSAVRITHLPTGLVASIQDERSQHQNKAKALKLVSARVNEAARSEERKKRGEERNSLIGGGERSERIRTYNFPQDRITDHRTKVSQFGIKRLLEGGELPQFFSHELKNMRREELLRGLKGED